ncbi:hypothetical protein N7G274_001181 [Stereocaulon virgatum]|uniref:PH domain-containing protein n=1 Tax=Stereocaulon virgatum TaxID=373712 RepID=A0ABR4AQU9_9LECA
MSQSIQPLRISKNTPITSPSKAHVRSSAGPLTELGPMERRRNSPSYNQATKRSIFNEHSSPFESSPFNSNSPRQYWQSRDPGSPTRFNAENRAPLGDRDTSPSPSKRPSVENLKRASRVKNSNMFAREHKQEYDPASSPLIERPLATGRPLSTQVQGNAYGGRGLEGFRKENATGDKKPPVNSPLRSPLKMDNVPQLSSSPGKCQTSPGKSSLSKNSRYAQAHQAFDPENGIWSDEEDSCAEHQLPPGKSLHRHAKSVTFDAAPPQVNEYEMTTPDPSSVASGSREGSYDSADNEEDESFDRGSSPDREDSFDASLEDTEKTPVVLPEDWRFMSPAMANDDVAAHVEDPFDGERSSPAPTVEPSLPIDARCSPARTDSVNSNGERRPLPPLPALSKPMFPRARSDSDSSLTATAERVNHAQRTSPSPPRPASISKSEIRGMGGCSMPIEERLRLMMLQDEEKPQTAADEQHEQRERRLRRGSPIRTPEPQQNGDSVNVHEGELENDVVGDLGEYKLPPRISRESILRKVKSRNFNEPEDELSSLGLSPGPGEDAFANLDPDVPVPSVETDTMEKGVIIKQEILEEDSELDVYSIPDLYSQQLQAESFMNAIEKLEAFKESKDVAREDDDDESHYSVDSKEDGRIVFHSSSAADDDGPPTPRAIPQQSLTKGVERKSSRRMSLPQFAALLGESDFGFGMGSFLTPSPPVIQGPGKSTLPTEQSSKPASLQQRIDRPVTPEAHLQLPEFYGQWKDSENEPQTPDSVIRHPASESPVPESPEVPHPVATIKAPGGTLKTRPSIAPSDVQAMAEVRRQVSNGSDVPVVPKIPERHLSRPSIVAEADEPLPDSGSEAESLHSCEEKDAPKQSKRKSSLLPLEVPVEGSDDGLGLGIESEFDRVIEAQKKGYLMRQNTKVIIASSASHESADSTTEVKENQEPSARGTRSAGNSPRKPSQSQPWTAEPWNGKIRRKSIRRSGGFPSKAPPSGPAPPMPGQQSNVASGLDSVTEDEAMQSMEEIGEDGERGRLFVKVVRVKDLDLPLPKGERSYFALTLDNGLHCVTTAWLELGKTAPIGQEFELVVLNDLEFQLTLQTKLEEPKVKPIVESPTKTPKPTKPSTFSRVFASPRKRKELEMKQQEEAQNAERQRQQAAQASRRPVQPTAWDLLHGLVAKDGSFARSYVCLQDHETAAYGRPYTVDVPCFNEWATEETNGNSVKSKRGAVNGGVQRKAPYKIGKLELQLLFVPKPKDAKDDDMPKSMNACIRELKEAESATPKKWEGHLSQQGGDCPYWRRRFFTLNGSKFTAYHEATRQPRATINLAKASKLIDDKSALMRNDVSPKKGGRRKSAFAEEEEGYMFVEEGFRVRFANGETIDFYADSAAEKDGWMKVLSEVVGKDTSKAKTWTDIVLAKRRAEAARAEKAQQGQIKAPPVSAKQAPLRSAPPTPAKHFTHSAAPPTPEKSPRRSDAGQRRPDVGNRRDAAKTRSMIF